MALAATRGGRAEVPVSLLHAHRDDGRVPYGGLSSDGAGNLYGTAATGGVFGCGVVYRTAPDGSGFTVLHSFTCGAGGAYPWVPPTPDGSGNLYGTTHAGGANGRGIVYSLKTTGPPFQVLHDLQPTEGSAPAAPLAFDGASTLYGTTAAGGAFDDGTIFKISTSGSGFLTMRNFTGANGAYPTGKLVIDGGVLWGTTAAGGLGSGVVFHVNIDGSGNVTAAHQFAGGSTDGQTPYGQVLLVGSGSTGLVIGTTRSGGSAGYGTIYSVQRDGGRFAILHSFAGSPTEGAFPAGDLQRDASGNLYGTTALGGSAGDGVVFGIVSGSYQTLHSFARASDGREGGSSMVLSGTTLFGTASYGGAADNGVVFGVETDGSGFSLVHTFPPLDEGVTPRGSLVAGEPGRVYGVTSIGGVSNLGTVFGMNTDGSNYSILHSFAGPVSDGAYGVGGLVFEAPNLLYGVTQGGGNASGRGAVFKMKTDGSSFSLLHKFAGGSTDGDNPYAGVVLVGNKLYGTTQVGGLYGFGTVYAIDLTNNAFSIAHSFGGAGDGITPWGALVSDGAGYLYGSTSGGGGSGKGTVFKLQANGPGYSLLHEFAGGSSDGAWPVCRLLYRSGLLYGTTEGGGTTDGGTVFRIDTAGGNYQVLRFFTTAAPDGDTPVCSTLDGGSLIYGGTYFGGTHSSGGVFSLRTDGSEFTWLHSLTPREGAAAGGVTVLGATLFITTLHGGPFDPNTDFAIPGPGTELTLWPGSFADGFEGGDTAQWSRKSL